MGKTFVVTLATLGIFFMPVWVMGYSDYQMADFKDRWVANEMNWGIWNVCVSTNGVIRGSKCTSMSREEHNPLCCACGKEQGRGHKSA
jgi:hypothetical protein